MWLVFDVITLLCAISASIHLFWLGDIWTGIFLVLMGINVLFRGIEKYLSMKGEDK